MERIFGIIKSEDFNMNLTNLLIDLYSSDYKKKFEELWLDEKEIDKLDKQELGKLTKIAAIIEYVGNRRQGAKLYDWIYSSKLKLDYPYTPGVENESIARIKRIFFSPCEFSSRNVFFDEKTLKPI